MVLYGRNGAGKTKVLTAISCALRGVAIPNAQLTIHLSLDETAAFWDDDLLFVLARVLNDNGASDVKWVPGANR